MTTTTIDGGNRAAEILADEYMAKPYARRLTPDPSGGYVASIQEFRGCLAEGDTAEEALVNLDRAAWSWIVAQLSRDQPVPEPVDFDGCSGRIALRMPRGLHKQAAERAAAEETSLNQLLITAIASYVGAKGVADIVLSDFRRKIDHFAWVAFQNATSVVRGTSSAHPVFVTQLADSQPRLEETKSRVIQMIGASQWQ